MSLNSKAYNASKTLMLQLCQASNSPSNARMPQGKLIRRMLDFINRNSSLKNINVTLPLYSYISLVKPHLEYAVQFWAPYHAKDVAKLETFQRRATKMITSFRNKSYEEGLARLNLFSRERKTATRKNY